MSGECGAWVAELAGNIRRGARTTAGTWERTRGVVGIDPHFIHRILQAANVAGIVLHQFGIDVEIDDVSLVLVSENLAQEGAADLLLRVEDVAVTARGVAGHPQLQRQVRIACRIFYVPKR